MITPWGPPGDRPAPHAPRRVVLVRKDCHESERVGAVLEESTPAGPTEQAIVVDAMGGDNGPAVVVAGAAGAPRGGHITAALTCRPSGARGAVVGGTGERPDRGAASAPAATPPVG